MMLADFSPFPQMVNMLPAELVPPQLRRLRAL